MAPGCVIHCPQSPSWMYVSGRPAGQGLKVGNPLLFGGNPLGSVQRASPNTAPPVDLWVGKAI